MMHKHEKSRSAIVAVKPTNKAERTAAEQSAAEPTAAEPVERRAETKGSADQQRTRRTQRRISVSKMLARIRQHIAAVDTQGGNRMRESCKYGSVRGARGNSRPYRDRLFWRRAARGARAGGDAGEAQTPKIGVAPQGSARDRLEEALARIADPKGGVPAPALLSIRRPPATPPTRPTPERVPA